MNKTSFFIFGGYSTAVEIAETVALTNPEFELWHVVADDDAQVGANRIKDKDLAEFAANRVGEKFFILSQSNCKIRSMFLAVALGLSLKPYTVIHPSAFISKSARIGLGVYIAARAAVSSSALIRDHSMLNMGIIFGHDASCGEHFVGSPGSVIGGNASIGKRVFIGANSFIYQGLEVGDDVQVDAMTYVYKNIESKKLCANRNLTVVNRFGMR